LNPAIRCNIGESFHESQYLSAGMAVLAGVVCADFGRGGESGNKGIVHARLSQSAKQQVHQ
jgi:hypothetical protein